MVILRFSTGKECWRPRFPCCSRVNYTLMIKKRPDYIYSEGKVDSFLFLWLRVCFLFFIYFWLCHVLVAICGIQFPE